MKKLERSEKDYAGGRGKYRFESDLFSVIFWKLPKGTTTIEIKNTHVMINFDGDQEFLSDDDCFCQLNPDEIVKIINAVKDKAFKKGAESKVTEFKKVFGI